MEPLAKLLVSILDLAEAELKTLKSGVIRLGLSLVMLIGAGIFGIIGLCWLLEAAYLLLERLTNRPTALAIVGVLFVAIAAILGVMAFGSKKTKTPIKAEHGKADATSPEGQRDDQKPAGDLRIAS